MFLPRPSAKQRQFCCVFYQTENGDVKMDRRDQELLDKQMRRLTPPRDECAIAVMLASMFLVGPRRRPVPAPNPAPKRADTNRIVGVAGAFHADHPVSCSSGP